MESTIVAVKELPGTLQNALKNMGYRGKDIRVYLAHKTDMAGFAGEGYKSIGAIVNIATGEFHSFEGSWGGPNPYQTKPMDVQTKDYDIPENGAVIKGEFGGTGGKTYLSIYVNPKSIIPMLPGKTELSTREEKIIYTHQYTSKYKKEMLDHLKVKPEEFASLVSKGLVKQNSAGATSLTTKGKNEFDRIYKGGMRDWHIIENIVSSIRELAVQVGINDVPKKVKGAMESGRLFTVRELSRQLIEQEPVQDKKIPKISSKKTYGGEKLLMKKVKYKVGVFTGNKNEKEDKEVEGIALNRWVAIREPEEKGTGWFVDHIPTGKSILQGIKNRKLALVVGKSFVDFIPENVQRQNSADKMFRMLDKAHAQAFFRYTKDILFNRTDLPFEVWKKDTRFDKEE